MDSGPFKPYQPVLVRNDNYQVWVTDFFSHTEKTPANNTIFITSGGKRWAQCIPYRGNETLHNTNQQK